MCAQYTLAYHQGAGWRSVNRKLLRGNISDKKEFCLNSSKRTVAKNSQGWCNPLGYGGEWGTMEDEESYQIMEGDQDWEILAKPVEEALAKIRKFREEQKGQKEKRVQRCS